MSLERVHIFCDFDGTITVGDTVDFLLEELADDEWRSIEAEWERGAISSRECMTRQIPLIRGGWTGIREALAKVEVDDSFASFVAWTKERTIPLTIVSDGLDLVIHHLLGRSEIEVDKVWSNHLVETQGRLSLRFPERPIKVVCPSGHCKCQILSACPEGTVRVIIGDGRSDFCWAHRADFVFAKDRLLSYCMDEGIKCIPFETFADVRFSLEALDTDVRGVEVGAA